MALNDTIGDISAVDCMALVCAVVIGNREYDRISGGIGWCGDYS